MEYFFPSHAHHAMPKLASVAYNNDLQGCPLVIEARHYPRTMAWLEQVRPSLPKGMVEDYTQCHPSEVGVSVSLDYLKDRQERADFAAELYFVLLEDEVQRSPSTDLAREFGTAAFWQARREAESGVRGRRFGSEWVAAHKPVI